MLLLERIDLFLRHSVSKCAKTCCTSHSGVFSSSKCPIPSGCRGGPGRAPARSQVALGLGGMRWVRQCGFPVGVGVGDEKQAVGLQSLPGHLKERRPKRSRNAFLCVWFQWYLSKQTLGSAVVLHVA